MMVLDAADCRLHGVITLTKFKGAMMGMPFSRVSNQNVHDADAASGMLIRTPMSKARSASFLSLRAAPRLHRPCRHAFPFGDEDYFHGKVAGGAGVSTDADRAPWLLAGGVADGDILLTPADGEDEAALNTAAVDNSVAKSKAGVTPAISVFPAVLHCGQDHTTNADDHDGSEADEDDGSNPQTCTVTPLEVLGDSAH